jgi:hypothetical protein
VDGLVYTDGLHTTWFEVFDVDSLARTYVLNTDHPQRDYGAQDRTLVEQPGSPVLRSGSTVFDALFALAIEEVDQLSVSEINDGAFTDGAGVPCECFQTGELWHYVWTRDTAYAVDLSLAFFDPVRARNSLQFKLSAEKAAVGSGGLQIVQDTGSGGSWPVSTDRVVWALGAHRVLALLDGAERDAFRDDTLTALINTAEVDRTVVWDSGSGLYRGETSFLDWRQQTYPQWTAGDVRHIAESQSLSTNVGHWATLDLASRLAAEVGDGSSDSRYRGWADDLATAIEAELWLDGHGWSRGIPNHLDPTPLEQFDWLGTSLAALHIGSADHASTALSSYPHGPYGPAVIWPQQPLVPIYHNRAIWPFVTAYGVRAAAAHGHGDVMAAGVESIVRGAALNLSNMENLELQTGANWFDDGAYSGPIVNSRRQLWSVAAYLSMVMDLFGIAPEADGLLLSPAIPEEVRQAYLLSDQVRLQRLPYKGQRFDLVLEFPDTEGDLWVAGQVQIDGVDHVGPVTVNDLSEGSVVTVRLVDSVRVGRLRSMVDDGDFTQIYAPRDPAVSGLQQLANDIELSLDDGGEAGVSFDIWRDGVLLATAESGPTWLDTSVNADTASPCYVVSTRFASGHSSQHSAPRCWWGPDDDRVQQVDAYGLHANAGQWGGGPGLAWWWDWGEAADTLSASGVRPNWTGEHLIQVVHANGAGPIDTGITAAHKWLTVTNSLGAVVGEGPVVLPQSGDWSLWRESTGVRVELDATQLYTVTMSDASNMTRLEHFASYTAGLGGGTTAYNRVDVQAFRLLPLAGSDEGPASTQTVWFDGVDDLNKLPGGAVDVLGTTLQPWEAVGLTWDDEALSIAWVSEAFEDDWAPAVLYIEAASTALGAAGLAVGFEYSNQIPDLPFTPTHAIALRAVSDAGAGEGPWNGVRSWDGADWTVTWRLEAGADVWLAADRHTLSTRIPRDQLGDPRWIRMAAHVVHAQPGQEFVDTWPVGHAPAGGGGAYYEIDLQGSTDVGGWTLR